MTADRLLSVPEVAERLGISRTSVYDVLARERVETVPLGVGRRPRIRVRESVLEALIDRLTRRVRR